MIKVDGLTHDDLIDCGCFHPQRRHHQLSENMKLFYVWVCGLYQR